MVKKILKSNLVYIFLVCLVISAFLYKGFTSNGIFFAADEVASDLLHFTFPYKDYWAKIFFATGKLPLWNSYLSSGMPFLAEAQAGMLFPVTIFLFAIFNKFLAFNLVIISGFLITGIGTYFYARDIGISRLGSSFTAITFALSGFMVGHLRHVPIITAVAFMPVMFLSAEKIIKGKTISWGILLAVTICFSFFAGHLTTTYSILIILTFHFFVRAYFEFKKRKEESLKEIVVFIFALIFGILFSAIQLVPSIELYKYSTRTENENLSLLSSPYSLKYLTLFIAPYAYGDPSKGTWDIEANNYWENIGYIGIIPLLLAFFAIFKVNKNKAITITLIFAFILMLGNNLPFYNIFWLSVPGFSLTRIPGRFILFTDFFLAILAGVGFDYFKGKIVILLIGLTLIDIFIFGMHLNNIIPSFYFDTPEVVKFIQKDKDLFRVRSMENYQASWHKAWTESMGWTGDLKPYFDQKEALPPDLNLYYSLASTSIIYGQSGHFTVSAPVKLDSYPDLALYGIMNIKYLISSDELPKDKNLKLVFQTRKNNYSGYVYQNLLFSPRTYFLGQSVGSDNLSDLPKEIDIDTSAKASVVNYGEEKVVIATDNKNSAYLVLSDTYYPGWKAYIDGAETKIYPANYAYRAVFVPNGKHEIKFVYEPVSYKIGKYISLGSLIIVLIFGGLYVFIRLKKKTLYK